MSRRTAGWIAAAAVHSAEAVTPAADQALSDARAGWLERWFREHGIERARLIPRGYGRSQPPETPGPLSTRVELRKLNEE